MSTESLPVADIVNHLESKGIDQNIPIQFTDEALMGMIQSMMNKCKVVLDEKEAEIVELKKTIKSLSENKNIIL